MENRRFWMACLVMVLTACVLCSLALIGGAVLVLRSEQAIPAAPEVTASPLPAATAAPTVPAETAPPAPQAPTATPTLAVDERLQVMERLERETAELRKLPILEPVQRTFYTQSELQKRVEEDFLKDYTPEDMARDQQVLSLFGLLPPDFDLKALYHDLYSEQIAGFYDDEAKEMVVVSEGDFTGVERLTYVHEFTHALQDQNFGLRDPEGLNFTEELCDQDSERCAAIQALVEGDATLTEYLWLFIKATAQEQRQIREFYADYTSPVFDSAPLFLQKDFLFPYEHGLNFVQALYSQGDWAAVNAAYDHPPVSTEQILHPERYPDDVPQSVALPDGASLLGEGWQLLEQDVIGEWYTYLILAAGNDPAARLPDEQAQPAAAGWGGDAYAIYRRDDDGALAMMVDWRWDSGNDRYEFAEAFVTYATARFGTPAQRNTAWGEVTVWATAQGVHWFQTTGKRTVWVFAPDDDTAALLFQALQENP